MMKRRIVDKRIRSRRIIFLNSNKNCYKARQKIIKHSIFINTLEPFVTETLRLFKIILNFIKKAANEISSIATVIGVLKVWMYITIMIKILTLFPFLPIPEKVTAFNILYVNFIDQIILDLKGTFFSSVEYFRDNNPITAEHRMLSQEVERLGELNLKIECENEIMRSKVILYQQENNALLSNRGELVKTLETEKVALESKNNTTILDRVCVALAIAFMVAKLFGKI